MSKMLVSREYSDISVNSELDFLKWQYLIDTDDITKKAILFGDSCLKIGNTKELTPDNLNEYLNIVIEEDGSSNNISDSYLVDYLNERFNLELNNELCSDYETFEDKEIIYSFNEQEFIYANDLEYYDIYTFWDGSNWQNWVVEWNFENIDSKYEEICIDEWDGNNNVTGGLGYHSYVKKLKDDKYLITVSSQWQGSQDIATIADKNELVEYLKIYDRDVDEYLDRFENIE